MARNNSLFIHKQKLADGRLAFTLRFGRFLSCPTMDAAGPSRNAPAVKTRAKGTNWTEDERIELVHEIDKRQSIIRKKFNNIVTKAAKKKAWAEIASVMNSRHPATMRTVDKLKKQWQNLKQRSRDEYKLSVEANTKTGEFATSLLHITKL